MNQKDIDFLRGMMMERMTQHYGATFPKSSESTQRLGEMEYLLNQVMNLLPEEQVENVHKYLEFLFERSAESEELFYRSGLLDGIKLSSLFHSIEVDGLTV